MIEIVFAFQNTSEYHDCHDLYLTLHACSWC